MKKIHLLIVGFGVIVLAALVTATVFYAKPFLASKGIHMLDGKLMYLPEENDLKKYILNEAVVKIKADTGEYLVRYSDIESDIDVHADMSAFDLFLSDAIKNSEITFDEALTKSSLEMILADEINKYDNNTTYRIIKTEMCFEPEELHYHSGIDIEKLIKKLRELCGGGTETTLNLSDYIMTVPDNEEDHELVKKYVEDFNAKEIKYSNGKVLRLCDYPELWSLSDDGRKIIASVEAEAFAETLSWFVKEELKSYNTTEERIITATINGKEFTLENHGVGEKVNETAEVAALTSILTKWEEIGSSLQEEVRHPERDVFGDVVDIGKNCILVDKEKQTLTCYKKGKAEFTCPVVTGLPTEGRETPTGIFYILERKKNYQMESVKVNYWLRITWAGHGLHDANWQEKFGDDWYLTHGSHGCVNIPPESMPVIYDNYKCYDIVIII